MNTRFQKLSMTQKMTVTLVIPMVLLVSVIVAICYPIVQRSYSRTIYRTISQSVEQAGNFMNEYVQSMEFRMARLSTDKEIQDILLAPGFGISETDLEEYHEYYEISEELIQIQGIDSRYQMAVYVPDGLSYATNRMYFYPESSFFAQENYEEIDRRLNLGETVWGIGVQRSPVSFRFDEPERALIMYRKLFDGTGNPRNIYRVSFSEDALRQVLTNANVTRRGVIFTLAPDDSLLFYAGDADDERAAALHQAWLAAGRPKGLSIVTLLGERYFVEVSDQQLPLVALIPASEVRLQTLYVLWIFLAMGGALVVMTLLITTSVVRNYVDRLAKLNAKMTLIEQGDINARFHHLDRDDSTKDEIEQIFYNFNYMTERVRELLIEHYRMGKSVQAAELKALQAQINPHFLYNTLDLINWMALDYDADEIADISKDLARFYRLSLNHGKNLISIGEEIEHVEAYVRIENVHFDGAIDLTVDVPDEIRSFSCPNIILQPFVENSIVHGIADHPEIKSCKVHIQATLTDGVITFKVADDGPGIGKDDIASLLDYREDSKGYGVRNINFRLKLYYGEDFGVSYETGLQTGTTAIVRIPAKSDSDLPPAEFFAPESET